MFVAFLFLKLILSRRPSRHRQGENLSIIHKKMYKEKAIKTNLVNLQNKKKKKRNKIK